MARMRQADRRRAAAGDATTLTVVGVGASAGGLKALQAFVGAVPADSGMAFVLILHLSPDRASRMGDLLQDRAAIPVHEVVGPTKVEANRIYIIPPGHDLAMEGRMLTLRPRGERADHAPVDLLFRTLAESMGADAAGVVLSGTGEDGSAGIRYIREAGGLTVAQTPAEAEYAGMPTSAIATGLVDRVLDAARIPTELLRLCRLPTPLTVDEPDAAEAEVDLTRVLTALRTRTGHDFSRYKRTTVRRRLSRRLRFHEMDTIEAYAGLLQASGEECDALLRDLLISVSSFFRDPDAFEALAARAALLFADKVAGDTVRVWVVGCATGEEVYSIAMVLSEHASTLADPPQLQLFATDIDQKGYAHARAGVYTAAAVANISPERLARFFSKEPGGYRITKALREQVLFASHNVLHDPPFSRMDLVSCRNLFIYFQPDAQAQVLETFHFALNPGGLLLLGAAETVGDGGLFTPCGGPQRIFRRNDGPARLTARLSAADPVATTVRTAERVTPAAILFEVAPYTAPVEAAPADPPPKLDDEALEEELQRTRELLDATSHAHERTVAALQAANEELLSINEEQKAATEELETGREEIQSINEELTTINQEHQSTIEELKRTNTDLQNLIESTEIGTIFLDRSMRIRRFTPAASALFSFAPGDEGRPLSDLTHRLSHDGLADDVASVLDTLVRIEREVASNTGRTFIMRINPYRSSDGRPEGAVLTFFDSTEQHRIASELRLAKSAAESANLAKGTFLSTLSHEFRTPLTAIIGYTHLLELDGALTAGQLQKVDRIRVGGWHLTSLIDEILSFAKLDGGQEVVHAQATDARNVVREAGALIEPAAAAKGLSFVIDVPDVPVALETDLGKTRQILLNLCGNAVKYTDSGEIRLRMRAERERVVFEVRDTGVGIAAEHHHHIFERFWQVDGSSTRAAGGMGIGLAAAREYARLLGGDVGVDSEQGRGTTFRLWLPCEACTA